MKYITNAYIKWNILQIVRVKYITNTYISPLNAELNPICHLLALLGAHHILHVGGVMVK